jgi:hypothetical protein
MDGIVGAGGKQPPKESVKIIKKLSAPLVISMGSILPWALSSGKA